jgi:hypothetical protein
LGRDVLRRLGGDRVETGGGKQLRMPQRQKSGRKKERETNVTSWCVSLDVAVEAK